MAEIVVSDEVLSAVVNYIDQTSKLLTKHASEEADMLRKAPGMVNTLIKSGFLHENERLAAIEASKDPRKLVDTVVKMAELETQRSAPPPSMGGTNSVKEAAVTPPSNVSPAMEEANRRFMAQFGF